MIRPADHPQIPASTIGVLLVNLGTPDAPTPKAVRRYLGEFLSDRRVVELPPILWQPILRGIILNTRPKKSAHAYAQVWTDQDRRSPRSRPRRPAHFRSGWGMVSKSPGPCAMAIRRSARNWRG